MKNISEILEKTFLNKANSNLIQNKFSKDVLWTFGGLFIVASSGFLINVMLGNRYGADGLGIFSQALAIYMLITLLSDLGTANSTVKFVSEFKDDSEQQNKYFTASLSIALSLSIVIAALVVLLSYYSDEFFYSGKATILVRHIIIGLPFFIANRIFISYFNGNRTMKIYSAGKSLRWIFIILLIIIALAAGLPLRYTIMAFPLGEFLLFVSILFIFIIKKRSPSIKFDRKYIKASFLYGYKISLGSLLSEGTSRTDILIASFFISDSQIGIYSFASTFARGFIMLSGIVQVNFNPIISNLYANKQLDELKEKIKKISGLLVKVNLPIIGIICILYPFIVQYLMGSEFGASIPVFYIIITGIAIVSIYGFLGGFLSMAGFPATQLLRVSLIFVFHFITMAVLVHFFGLYGAAIAVALLYFARFFSTVYYIKRKTGIAII